MLGEVVNTLAEKRDLHFGGTGIALMGRVLGNNLLLYSGFEGHDSPSLLSLRGARGIFTQALSDRGRRDGEFTALARLSVLPAQTQLRPSVINVTVHLINQFFQAIKFHIRSQPLHKFKSHVLVIKVQIVPVQYVSLNTAVLISERWVGSHRNSRRQPLPICPHQPT